MLTDLDLMVAGIVVTFIAVSGAYVNIRRRANRNPVDSYDTHAQEKQEAS